MRICLDLWLTQLLSSWFKSIIELSIWGKSKLSLSIFVTSVSSQAFDQVVLCVYWNREDSPYLQSRRLGRGDQLLSEVRHWTSLLTSSLLIRLPISVYVTLQVYRLLYDHSDVLPAVTSNSQECLSRQVESGLSEGHRKSQVTINLPWDEQLSLCISLRAVRRSCTNAAWPDIHGHYREAQFTQTKHHWWWKANRVFGALSVTQHFTGRQTNGIQLYKMR